MIVAVKIKKKEINVANLLTVIPETPSLLYIPRMRLVEPRLAYSLFCSR